MIHQAPCIAHDADWQFPAITEQHAYHRARDLLPPSEHVAYLAFPWATLIDQLQTLGQKAGEGLLAALRALVPQLGPYKHVLTVCQHIKALQYADLFTRAGVTDLYWSHCAKETKSVPFQIHPFPLFPVQRPEANLAMVGERPLLFSFVGARANKWYLTQARNHVIDLMGSDTRGLVVGRDQWHFNKVVYDHQIRKTSQTPSQLVDQDTTEEYRRILSDSVFSICPGGTGPNSIRLWESIGFGAIPVILADTYQPPGPAALWEEAAVWCDETPEAIRGLADRLDALRREPSLLERKRKACAQIWALYGPDTFIYDLQCRTVALHAETRDAERPDQKLPRSLWLQLAATILQEPECQRRAVSDLFLQSTTTRILTERDPTNHLLSSRRGLAKAVHLATMHAEESRISLFRKAAKLHKLEYLLEPIQ